MSGPWTLEVPAPCDWINSNQRLHRMELARRVAEWRKAAGFHARRHGGYFTSPVRIIATVHKTRGGRWDAGNLYPTAKAIVDGLVDAGGDLRRLERVRSGSRSQGWRKAFNRNGCHPN